MNRILTVFLASILVLPEVSCSNDVETKYVYVEKKKDDTAAPADVTGLSVVNKGGAVMLSWTDASDGDIFGYEISWNQKETQGIDSSERDSASSGDSASTADDANKTTSADDTKREPLTQDSLVVSQGNAHCFITNLVNGTEYTFLVKAVDTSGNKSDGVSVDFMPYPNFIEIYPDVSQQPTKASVPVGLTVVSTNEVTDVKYCAAAGIRSAKDVFDSEEALSAQRSASYSEHKAEWAFSVVQNGSYSVVAKDSQENYEIIEIIVRAIDTECSDVSRLKALYDADKKTIAVSWVNPLAAATYDSPVVKVRVSYKRNEEADVTCEDFFDGGRLQASDECGMGICCVRRKGIL